MSGPVTITITAGVLNIDLFDLCNHAHQPRPHHDGRLFWRLGPVSEQFLPGPFGVPAAMADRITLTDSQQVILSLRAVDKKGQEATVDSVLFQTSDESIAALVIDGQTATVVAGGVGTAQVTVTVDADLGQGVTPLAGVIDVIVIPGQAVGLQVVAGIPSEQPDAPAVP